MSDPVALVLGVFALALGAYNFGYQRGASLWRRRYEATMLARLVPPDDAGIRWLEGKEPIVGARSIIFPLPETPELLTSVRTQNAKRVPLKQTSDTDSTG